MERGQVPINKQSVRAVEDERAQLLREMTALKAERAELAREVVRLRAEAEVLAGGLPNLGGVDLPAVLAQVVADHAKLEGIHADAHPRRNAR